MMKLLFLVFFLLIYTGAFAQYRVGENLLFIDSTQTPLEFFTDQFHNRVGTAIDSSCLQAYGTVKFTIYEKGIKNVFVSVGIPEFIVNPLKKAIDSSQALWQLNGTRKEVELIIPLFILPSSLCRRENYRDNLLTTMANSVVYEGIPERVLRNEYLKKATGAEEAFVLPPLIIRSQVVDVYKMNPYVK